MRLTLGDWLLDVDIELTMSISAAQASEHCDCGYCKNFYETLDAAYPSIRPFLMKFGLHAEAPDELCPFEPTIYEATYIVQGTILQFGTQNLTIDGVPLTICSSQQADMCTEHPEPYFTLCIGLMELPWSLPEPMDQVISPAKEEEYLLRMQQKLLQRLDNETIRS